VPVISINFWWQQVLVCSWSLNSHVTEILPSVYTTPLYFTPEQLQLLKGSPVLCKCTTVSFDILWEWNCLEHLDCPQSHFTRAISHVFVIFKWTKTSFLCLIMREKHQFIQLCVFNTVIVTLIKKKLVYPANITSYSILYYPLLWWL